MLDCETHEGHCKIVSDPGSRFVTNAEPEVYKLISYVPYALEASAIYVLSGLWIDRTNDVSSRKGLDVFLETNVCESRVERFRSGNTVGLCC